MAILPHLPHVRVSIVVNGEDLPEYVDQGNPDELGYVSRYVEASSNTPFGVRITALPGTQGLMRGDCLSFAIYADGQHVTTMLVLEELLASGGVMALVQGAIAQSTLHKMYFSDLTHTDPAGEADDGTQSGTGWLGNISIMVRHARRTGHVGTTATIACLSELQGTHNSPIKPPKGSALTHTVSMGTPERTPDLTTYDVAYLGPDETNAGKYHFRYRSMERLQSMPNLVLSPSESSQYHMQQASKPSQYYGQTTPESSPPQAPDKSENSQPQVQVKLEPIEEEWRVT